MRHYLVRWHVGGCLKEAIVPAETIVEALVRTDRNNADTGTEARVVHGYPHASLESWAEDDNGDLWPVIAHEPREPRGDLHPVIQTDDREQFGSGERTMRGVSAPPWCTPAPRRTRGPRGLLEAIGYLKEGGGE